MTERDPMAAAERFFAALGVGNLDALRATQQHVLRGTAPSAVAIEIPACIVRAVANGRISRLDEYLDSAQVAPLLAG